MYCTGVYLLFHSKTVLNLGNFGEELSLSINRVVPALVQSKTRLFENVKYVNGSKEGKSEQKG